MSAPTIAPGTRPLDLTTAAELPAGAVLARLGTLPGGLSTGEALVRLRIVGPHVLATHHVSAARFIQHSAA